MKTFKVFSILLLASLLNTTLFGQRTINVITDGAAVSADVDEQTKNEIIDVVQEVLNKYYNIASFWNENAEEFDENKYTQFIGMFSGSARVYDDIAEEPTNIEYSVYANNVFQYMQEEGVQFLLENVYLNSIEKDEGFYVADLDMDKIVYVGLDKQNFPVKFGDGKRYTLNVKIDMPDYDVKDAKIQSITGEEAAKRVKTAGYLSGNFHYGIGSYVEGPVNSLGQSFGALTSKAANTLGFQLLFRKALNPAEKFWFHIGVGGQQHTLKTGYGNFDNSGLPGEQRSQSDFEGAFMNGGTPTPYIIENGSVLQGNVTINNINNAQEIFNVITVDVPIGATIRLNRTFSSRIFLDVSVVPSYSITSSGTTSGNPEGVFIPNSEHFPTIEQIQNSPNGQERLEEYSFDDDDFRYEDNDLSLSQNSFNLGLQLSPTYMYDISFNYGIEVGFNLWYNVLSLVGSQNSERGYLSSDYANNSFATKTSILEDYFEGVKPFYGSVKLGFFYKIN
ncbi:hypothetical protein [Portibacter marinus]|uniref:hypothetical protein n=1 Tax=Portibacter marinus TaxID=2898660 RepID=UPI001F407B50|nr:hypothetical protein [Portibacter marinus]